MTWFPNNKIILYQTHNMHYRHMGERSTNQIAENVVLEEKSYDLSIANKGHNDDGWNACE